MKRIIELIKYKKTKNGIKKRINDKHTICITSVATHLGKTHLALSIANFIRSCLKERVIFIELSDDSRLLSTVGENIKKVGSLDGFVHKGVEYILTPTIEEIQTIMAKEKAWIVIDMNELNEATQVVFLKSKIKVLIGSMMPWCQREYHEYVRNRIDKKYDYKDIKFLDKNPTKEGEKLFRKLYGCKVNPLPIINNPFSLEEKDFKKLLEIIYE